jgi:hypothetical protein
MHPSQSWLWGCANTYPTSGSCTIVVGVEPSGSATAVLVVCRNMHSIGHLNAIWLHIRFFH